MSTPYKKRIDNDRYAIVRQSALDSVNPRYSTQTYAALSSSTPQSISADTDTQVEFTSKIDSGNIAAITPVNSITIPTTGVYLLEFYAGFAMIDQTSVQRTWYIFKNGSKWYTSTVRSPTTTPNASGLSTTNNLCVVQYLNAGDILGAYVNTSQATTISNSGVYASTFDVTFLGDGVNT